MFVNSDILVSHYYGYQLNIPYRDERLPNCVTTILKQLCIIIIHNTVLTTKTNFGNIVAAFTVR